mmetsp:Transcript_44677/g.61058  ORF Transcript_44677/g.61058 Transcript_44677/m.61058 type:complete len:114 (+) Transcript_44677:377-718(+)|eukprot:CAMPEP_0185792936 /NCGR_PEP_ID=MMETSP1174-20130828/159201_1 /TAXON_ID=35687 /ORGANISM="Dictyocha speculum, Strain CCMP1381" /LENGTH=113 /DNA_ID=CAMNT_0028488039 /DNA_START=1556 /DNA_END=1897 /DNA_ORIENTATION=-
MIPKVAVQVYVASRRRLAEADVTAKFLTIDAEMSNADTIADFRFAILDEGGSYEAVNSIDTSIDVPAGVEVGEEPGISVGGSVGEAVRGMEGSDVGILYNSEGGYVEYGFGEG